VAGDRLRRVAITCLWLTHADAALVCTEGETGLRQAMASGRLTTSTDREGRELVHAVRGDGQGRAAADPTEPRRLTRRMAMRGRVSGRVPLARLDTCQD